jgi:hypothetical protein
MLPWKRAGTSSDLLSVLRPIRGGSRRQAIDAVLREADLQFATQGTQLKPRSGDRQSRRPIRIGVRVGRHRCARAAVQDLAGLVWQGSVVGGWSCFVHGGLNQRAQQQWEMTWHEQKWRALMLCALLACMAGCASNSTPIAQQSVEPARIPPLPPEARQPSKPSICLPTCSAGVARMQESWLSSLTLPTVPAPPASGSQTDYSLPASSWPKR